VRQSPPPAPHAIVRPRSTTRATGLAAGVAVLAGCAAHAPVGTEFPRALVDPLPLRMGVEFTEELKTYEHVETIPGDREWIVTLGPANRAMFARLFDAMFEETVVREPGGEDAQAGDADSVDAAGGTPETTDPPVDAILVPTIESYEFANPLEADDDHTTVWITYRIRLTDPEGRLIAEFPVRAYGRSPYGFMGGEESLIDATHMAMRDAGAYIALHFADEPRIREWLRETGKLENPYEPEDAP
jgi:hypothetical protein